MRGLHALTTGLVLALVLGACGSTNSASDPIRGTELTIYSSLPLQGPSAAAAQAVLSGETLALAQSASRIGHYRIVLRPLDDASAARQGWDPGETTANAREAARDSSAVGYIGDFNSGATAVSTPLLNLASIPQITPTSTAVGLTADLPGAAPGEPGKYYPSGVRTLARVIPNDYVQAQVQVALQAHSGCRRTFVLDDGEFDGYDYAATFQDVAQSQGLPLSGRASYDPAALDYSSLALTIARTTPDCLLLSALPEQHATLVTEQLAAAMPRLRIFATAGLAQSSYTDPTLGGIPSSLHRRVIITGPALPAANPASARAFLTAYTQRFGTPQPYAVYGYEAMRLMLSAIARASHRGRQAPRRAEIVKAIFATRDHPSLLGDYSIDRNGDTTLRSFGIYRVVGGRLTFRRAAFGRD